MRRDAMRNRLIESRLTPNAISLTGFALNVVAAVLVWQELFISGGIAFIVGSICDTLDGRYSRMSGKGTQFGAFLDSTLDRIEEGIVLTAVAYVFAKRRQRRSPPRAVVVAVLASLMVSYTRARAEALGRRVQGRHRQPRGPRRDPVGRYRVRRPRWTTRLRAGRLRAGGAGHDHRPAADPARAQGAQPARAQPASDL